MGSDRTMLERQLESVELRPFTLERFHRRRSRKQRNRRIGTAVVALILAAAAIGGLARTFLSGREPRPADRSSDRFVGTWSSRELIFDESLQTMTIRAVENGGVDITLRDGSNVRCSDRQTRTSNVDTPSTLTGKGRLEDATTVVVTSPTFTCADGRGALVDREIPEEAGGVSYTLVVDLATGRLFDNLGVAWHRGEPSVNRTTQASVRSDAGSVSFLYGEVTFEAGRPWDDHFESYLDPRIFWLVGRPDSGVSQNASVEILANPSAEISCDAPPRVPGSTEQVVQALRSDPNLETTPPVAARIGGMDAVRLDVTPVPGAQPCDRQAVPVVSVPGRSGWGAIDQGDRGRIYVVDVPGGYVRALAILITAPEASFETTVAAAEPVVASFEFHLG